LESLKTYVILYFEKVPTSGKGSFDVSPAAVIRRPLNLSPAQKLPTVNQEETVSETVEVINLPEILRAKTDAQISRVFSKSCDVRSRKINESLKVDRSESTIERISDLNESNVIKKPRLFNIPRKRLLSASTKMSAFLTPSDESKIKTRNLEILVSSNAPKSLSFNHKITLDQIKSHKNAVSLSPTIISLRQN
jgi:hypothetical protein